MFADEKKRVNTCYNCNGKLEVVEADLKRQTKVMKCPECGLYHLYGKDLLGSWKLEKVTKDPERSMKVDW